MYGKLTAIILLFFTFSSIIKAQPGFQLPEYQKVELENGLTLFLMEQHETPLISISAAIRVGAVDDFGQNGMSYAVSRSLLLGAGTFSKMEIEEKFEFLGARIGSRAYKEYSELYASFHKKDMKLLLPVFRDILTAPSFDNEAVSRELKKIMRELELDRQRPRSVISSYFHQMVFEDSQYANPIKGYQYSVKEFTLEKIKSFYKDYYRPDFTALFIVGDFDTKTLLTQIKDLFGNWQNPETLHVKNVLKPQYGNYSRVLLVNKEDSRESAFQIGSEAISRNNPDYPAITVINTFLGGRFTSMLNNALRIESGLTYGARSHFITYSQSGLFRISSYTATENTEKTIDMALAIYDSLLNYGFDEKLLKSAKKYVMGSFPLDYETTGQLANSLIEMWIYDLDPGYLNSFMKQVNELDMNSAKKIIDQYFPSEHLQFVIIGKATEIKEAVSKYGGVIEKEILDDGF